jgi:integrase
VDKATPADIECLYAHLLARGGNDGHGISPNTIHKLNTVLRGSYAFITRENPAIVNPMPSVELPSKVAPVKRVLTETEFSKVIDALERELCETPADNAGIERRNKLFGVYFGVHTGARVGEVCAITRGDVRVIDRAVRIEHSLTTFGGLHRKEPKTPSGRRTVTLDDEAWGMLREHYAWQASYLSDRQRDAGGTPVCCKADGSFIAPAAMSAAFKELCKGVGVELKRGESYHILRHTHATLLLSNGVNPKEVQQRMGHSRVETTFIYSHVLPGEDAAAAEKYGEIVAKTREAGGFR